MAGVLGRSLFFAFSLLLALPARADPLLMFLFSVAQEIAAKAKPAPAEAPVPPSLPAVYPGTVVQPAFLKRLINDTFTYLGADQREEVFQALHEELLKPANAPFRAQMIEFFIERSLQIRAAQIQLARLSASDKERLVAGFRQEVKILRPEEVAPLRQALEKNLLPVPADLNQLLLAQLDQPAAPATAQ